MYSLKERLLDRLYLTESVGFKRAFDSDYHHNEYLISFHRNGSKKSKEEYYAKVNDYLKLRPDTRKIPIANKLVYKSLIRYYSPK